MTLTGEVPVLTSSWLAREAYGDLQRALAGISTPCSPDEAWTAGLGPEAWTEDTPYQREARKLCRDCPVIEQCRAYAIAAEEPHGVWGGLLPHERSALIRNRRR